MSDEAADAAALTYLLTYLLRYGNTPMRLHTLMNDHSPISGIITVGDYVGGALFVEQGGVLWEGGGAGRWHK